MYRLNPRLGNRISMPKNVNEIITNYIQKEGVYIHSVPPSAEFYDSMWVDQRPAQHTGFSLQQRIEKQLELTELIHPRISPQQLKFYGCDRVLDVCAGHGGHSLAALEMGAKKVYMCDGSFASLRNFSKKIIITSDLPRDPSYYMENIIPVQANVENICDVFNDTFDLVFQRYAIHHMRNPFETARQLTMLVRPGGVLSFNFFITGCTPQIMRYFRRFFLTQNLKDTHDFLFLIGIINPSFKEYSLEDVLNDKVSMGARYDDIIEFFKEMMHLYGVEEIVSNLHYEDFRTPYLHNIDFMSFYRFLTDTLGLEYIDGGEASDWGSLTMQVPIGGSKERINVPHPSSFSNEDISLGDAMVGYENA